MPFADLEDWGDWMALDLVGGAVDHVLEGFGMFGLSFDTGIVLEKWRKPLATHALFAQVRTCGSENFWFQRHQGEDVRARQ